LIKFALKSKDLLFEKFDEIFILSPSIKEWKDLFLPVDNLTDELNFSMIKTKLDLINKQSPNKYTNVLIIIDDFVTSLKDPKHKNDIFKLAFNRRHLLNNGMYVLIKKDINNINNTKVQNVTNSNKE
jgi:hypothetical protein